MNGLALDSALTLCLSGGTAALLALNLMVLPATRDTTRQSLQPELSARALVATPLRVAAAVPMPPLPEAPAEPARGAQAHESAPRPLIILEFQLASSHLDRRAQQALYAAQVSLREALEIVVVGHADESGPEQLNEVLSARRAEIVARQLVGSGVAPARVRVEARGEREPREGNSRRVEIFVGGAP